MNIKFLLHKLLSILRAKVPIGGLEVSDANVRYVVFNGQEWKTVSVRIAPGVIERGEIKDYKQFVEVLKNLKNEIAQLGIRSQRVSVIVALSSINIYSQVFSLPIIEGENLEKAIQLNIQMASPLDTAQAYSGWQLVGEDQNALRLEILSAFINRSVVDEISRALHDAGFSTVAIESRALSLARLLRDQARGYETERAYILLSLDSAGLDLLVVRRGQLYFEYFNSWKDFQDEKQQISLSMFQTIITRNLHQVLNFYGQHWSDPVTEILLSATGLNKEIQKIVLENFNLATRDIALKVTQPMSADWFVALGSALRGLKPRNEDRELSLSGIGAEEEFRKEQLINFLSLWKLLFPVGLGILILAFIATNIFLTQLREKVEAKAAFNLSSDQLKEIETLQSQAHDFNRSVALIKSVEASTLYKTPLIKKIGDALMANQIDLSRFFFQDYGSPVHLVGSAASEDQIVSFKKILDADPEFANIDLPLSNIKSEPGGRFSFSISFTLVQ